MHKISHRLTKGLGYALIYFDEKSVTRIELSDKPIKDSSKQLPQHVEKVLNDLQLYSEGVQSKRKFDYPQKSTAFQRKVWDRLQKIPYGETVSYGQIAKDIGSPKASRAVGQAVGANPFSLLIPCHRVLRNDGSLGGFFYGPEKKQQILAFEGIAFQ